MRSQESKKKRIIAKNHLILTDYLHVLLFPLFLSASLSKNYFQPLLLSSSPFHIL